MGCVRGFPQVIDALTRMHDELGKEGCLSRNIVKVVRAMADAVNLSIKGSGRQVDRAPIHASKEN